MASTKNITMRQFNGIDYDTLYPKTKAQQILGTIPVTSGGTGATTAGGAVDSLITALSTITPAAGDLIALKDANGTAGKTTLTALATLMSSLGGGAKIQTGSYVGTGTYGSSNPCSLTFDFVPVAFYISGPVASAENTCAGVAIKRLNNSNQSGFLVINLGYNSTTSQNPVYNFPCKFDGKTISYWAIAGPGYQCNVSGYAYMYYAIG